VHRLGGFTANSFFAYNLRAAFALGALVVAANGWPSLKILFLVVVCMVLARTAAMLFQSIG